LADIIDTIPNADLKLAHAQKVKGLSAGSKKTDKIDSELLANLRRCDLLPESHKSSDLSRELKEQLRYRSSIVSARVDLKNKLRDIIAKNNLHPRIADITSNKGRLWLKENIIKRPYNSQVVSILKVVSTYNEEIALIDKDLIKTGDALVDVDLLKTIPGVGTIVALTLLAEIDDISRFPDANRLCSYAGLVPRVSSSGGKTHMGRILKGNKYMKQMLAQACTHAIRKDPWLKAKYEKLKSAKSTGKARVAIMRKLMVSVYHVLSKREKYKFRELVE